MDSKEHVRTHSSSDEEKVVGSSGSEQVTLTNLPEDPDSDLSPEERKRIVGLFSVPGRDNMTNLLAGQKTRPQAGLISDPMGTC
jgi:hypothetical protein